MIEYNLKIESIEEKEIISKHTIFMSPKYEKVIKKKCWERCGIPCNVINGVYLIFNKGEVIKIGQSTDIFSRISAYNIPRLTKKRKNLRSAKDTLLYIRPRKNAKDLRKEEEERELKDIFYENWDSFAYYECSDDATKFIIEGLLVYMYKPSFNFKMNGKI